jgi:hypothetical protein
MALDLERLIKPLENGSIHRSEGSRKRAKTEPSKERKGTRTKECP